MWGSGHGNYQHGMSGTKIHGVWRTMISRCHNPSVRAYPDYGGRGIQVCLDWRISFENFYADMGASYREGLMLDREDNDRGYCKNNCRWVTPRMSSVNRRWALCIETPQGVRTLKDLAEESGISYYTLRRRQRRGLGFPEILYA